MKKRKLLSWTLSSAMIFSMIPMTVWAEEDAETPYDLHDIPAEGIEINRDVVISSGVSLGSSTVIINGDLYLASALDCATGTMVVHGNVYHTGGKLNINQGRLDVDGDYKLVSAKTDAETGEVYAVASPGYVQMTMEEGYFCVGGDYLDWSSRGEGGYNTFSAGTLELKGNFTQKGQENSFNAYGTHQVLFTGTEAQTVYFEITSNGFNTVGTSTNPLVEIQSGRITKLTANVTVQNFSQYGSLDLNGYSLTVKKNFTQTGSVKGNAGKLTVAGNYIQPSGRLAVEDATVRVYGDYRLQSVLTDDSGNTYYGSATSELQMTDDAGKLIVSGAMVTQTTCGQGGHNALSAGTLELKGDFRQVGNIDNFNCYGTHKVIFSGSKVQNIRFDCPGTCGFNILAGTSNTQANVVGRITAMGANGTLNSFEQYGKFSLGAYALTVKNNMTITGTVEAGTGSLTVKGDCLHPSGILRVQAGQVRIDGDYRLQTVSVDATGETVYDSASSALQMTNDAGKLTVGGTMVTQTTWGQGGYNVLSAGTLELKGDFQQAGSVDNFNCYGTHKVVFSGEKLQQISFAAPTLNQFNILSSTPNTKVDILAGNIETLGSDVQVQSFNQYGTLGLAGHTLTISGDLVQNGNINGEGGHLVVGGNYLHPSGILYVQDAEVTIDGDYRLQSITTDDEGNRVYTTASSALQMTNDAGKLTVCGTMVTQTTWGQGGYNALSAGTLELKGNFQQAGSVDNFNCYGTHKVVFSGEKLQQISFAAPTLNQFNILSSTPNTKVDILAGNIETLGSDVQVQSFNQYGTLGLAGHTLTISGDLVQNGSIHGEAGKLTVVGNYVQPSGILYVEDSTVRVYGDYRLQSITTDETGAPVYGSSSAALQMTDAAGKLIVSGTMVTQTNLGQGGYNALSAGTLELKGDFRQLGNIDNFYCYSSHKVVFSGSKLQTIYFEAPEGSKFNILASSSNAKVDIAQGNITKIGAKNTLRNFNQYGDLSINGKNLTVSQNITQNGKVSVDKGTLTVKGTYQALSGQLKLGGGKLYVNGDFLLASVTTDETGAPQYAYSNASLQMNTDADYMRVGGNFVTYSNYGQGGYNDFSDGTLELKGDFTQLGASENFVGRNQHKVVFSGEGRQTVYFESAPTSGFAILEGTPNTNVVITKGRINSLSTDAQVDTFVQYGTLDLSGHRLTVDTLLRENGRIYVNQGTLVTNGLFLHEGGILQLGGGTVQTNGDYRIQKIAYDEEGNPYYTTSGGALQMNTPTDYFLANGNFYDYSAYGQGGYNDFADGTLELKGNFERGGASENFNGRLNHKTVISGTGVQTIDLGSSNSSGIQILEHASNPQAVVKGRVHCLGTDSVLGSFTQYDSLDLQGHSLTVGTLRENGTIDVHGGTLKTTDLLLHEAGTLRVNGGSVITEGDYRSQTYATDENGDVQRDDTGAPLYTTGSGKLEMVNASDYMLVKGTFYEQSRYANTNLTAGMLEVKGNFRQLSGAGNNFAASKEHVTFLSGEDTQYISFVSSSSGFATLMIEKKTVDPSYVLETQVTVARLMDLTYLYNISKTERSTYVIGEDVVINGKGIGGAGGYLYSYYYRHSSESDSDYHLIGTFPTAETTATFKAEQTGTYYILVDVADAEGHTAREVFTVTINDVLQNNSRSSTDRVAISSSVTLYGAGAEGLPSYTYTYYYRKATGKYWTLIGAANTGSTYATFKPVYVTDYVLRVDVTDALGTVVSKEFPVSVYNDLSNVSTISSDGVRKGTQITIKGAAKGGKTAYTYAYFCKKSTSPNWTKLSDGFVSDSTMYFTPAMAATYIIRVDVRDATGLVISKEMELRSVGDLLNESEISAESVMRGTAVTLYGKSIGAQGKAVYAFYYKKASSKYWTAIGTEFGTDTTASFTPGTVAVYVVRIDVKDDSGKIVSKTFTVDVTTDYFNTSTVSASSVTKGTTVTINASAHGGKGSFTYAYFYKKSTSKTWLSLSDGYVSEDTFAFTPAMAADYIVRVDIKDSTGTVVSKEITIESTSGLINRSTVSAETVAKGTPITITGAAGGGSGSYTYRYLVKKSTSKTWTSLSSGFTQDTQWTYTPAMAAEYQIKVIVQDTKGVTAEKIFTITST